MGPLTRRHALHGAVALLSGLAGCSGAESETFGSTSPTPTVRAPATNGSEHVPEHYTLRSAENEPVVRMPDDESTGPAGEDEEQADEPWRTRYEVIATEETANSVELADVDGVDDARAFLTETDYETETLFVRESTVGECWELELCHVTWTATRIETDYGRRLRPVDVACSADASDTVVTFVRIPARLDPDEVHEFGSGTSSSECRRSSSRGGSGPENSSEASEGN